VKLHEFQGVAEGREIDVETLCHILSCRIAEHIAGLLPQRLGDA
jgi:hypothetical protein